MMSPSPSPSQGLPRAFTLVEMLVVVGIILVVVTLSLPSMLSARRASQVGVGAAQMKSLNDMLINRAMERKGKMLTLGDSQAGADSTLTQTFGYGSATRFTGEGFAAYWVSYLIARDPSGGIKQEMAQSPADGEVLHSAAAASGGGDILVPGSFYYSPTMFNSWHEYDFNAKSTTGCCPSSYGAIYRGDCCDPMHNCSPMPCGVGLVLLEEITFPDAKVVLFERSDFMLTSRSQTDGSSGKAKSRPLPPSWNNPKARPHVSLADGSVATVSISVLTQDAAESAKNDPELDAVPVDLFAAPDSYPAVGLNGNCVLDLTTDRTDGLYPYFFAGTRYGARGRDLTPDARK